MQPNGSSEHGVPDARSELNSSIEGVAERSVTGELMRRLDGPHFPVANMGLTPSRGGGGSLRSTADGAGTVGSFRPEANLLLQAGQMVEHLQIQLSELDSRERSLAEQLADLDLSQKNFRLEMSQRQSDCDLRERQVAGRESDLEARGRLLEQHFASTEKKRRELEAAAVELERAKSQLREQVFAELAGERERLAQGERDLTIAQKRLDELVDIQLRERERMAIEHEATLKHEREKLWQDLAAEWETNRIALSQQHAEWEAERAGERERLARQREVYERALEQIDQELSAARSSQLAEIRSLREEHDAAIASERSAWEREYQTQVAELQRERSQFDLKTRFQQEHLEKMRRDLDASQTAFRVERQREQTRLVAEEQQLLRRSSQIHRHREALVELERSLDRERDLLGRNRRAISSSADTERQSLVIERRAWDEERILQVAELGRQQELFAQHAENLENRRVRLDRLRAELEESHRGTLELRLAVEETWAKISGTQGDARTRQQIETARQELDAHYEQMRVGLIAQRDEVYAAIDRLETQKIEFQAERQTLTEWVASRDRQLREDETRAFNEAQRLAQSELAWKAAQDQWLNERLEAEVVIRRLLAELNSDGHEPEVDLRPGRYPSAA